MKSVMAVTAAFLSLAFVSMPTSGFADTDIDGFHVQMGGFLASETVYRDHNMASDIDTPFAKIPFENSMGYAPSEFRGSARQSRFSLLVQRDFDSSTRISGYYELDFLGAATTSNSNQSNSYTPRTRNVYLTVDWQDLGLHLLAGQNWSLVTLNGDGITPRQEIIPATIDAQYAVGFDWARQWQLRLVKEWNKKYWAGISFEEPQTVNVSGQLASGTGNTYYLSPGGLMSSNMSINTMPDVVAKFAWESSIGHYEIYNLARNFESEYGGTSTAAQTNHQNIWTDSVGAGATIPVIKKVLDLSLSGLIGRGSSRYGTSQLADATYDADGQLNPLNASQYLAQLTWHKNKNLDIYAIYGQESVNSSAGAGYGYGSGVVANNSVCYDLGSAACNPEIKNINQINIGFWDSLYKKNKMGVLKLGAQYSHTVLNTYADANGVAPSTSEDIVMTSLRYFPF